MWTVTLIERTDLMGIKVTCFLGQLGEKIGIALISDAP